MSAKEIWFKGIRKGLKVRRGGNPRTEIGQLRKAQVFEVEEVNGRPGDGFCTVLLRRDGEGFSVYACSLVERWERA